MDLESSENEMSAETKEKHLEASLRANSVNCDRDHKKDVPVEVRDEENI